MTEELTFREKLHQIIFATNTPGGHRFDVIITWLIIGSIATIILETVSTIGDSYANVIRLLEWAFTILFTIEYGFRIYAARHRWSYITSFFGIIDFLAIAPMFIGIFYPGQQSWLIIRILRLLRIFRIFEMGHFVSEGAIVANALKASKNKVIVFISFVGISTILMGGLMYMVEHNSNPHIQNIPEGIYWAIVTITTVGYGDAIPVTSLGKILASIVMILGYGVIAVPTGIVTAEITNRVLGRSETERMKCPHCSNSIHLKNAAFCHSCGESLI